MDRRDALRSMLLDVGLVLGLAILGLLEQYLLPTSQRDAFPRGPDLLGAVATIAVLLPLIWRRRFPIWVLVVSGVAYFLRLLVGYEPVGVINTAGLIAVYSVGVYAVRPAADRARWLVGLAIGGGFLWAYRIDRLSFTEVSIMFITWIAVAIFGETVYIRRRYQEALEDRARRLETEQDERARLAVQEERSRINREFHDIWAHTLGLVIVQAGAAQEVFDESPELARQALIRIEQAGRKALAEVRRVISIDTARTSVADLAPLPGLGDLRDLVNELGRAGLPVGLTIAGAMDDLPDDVGLSAYRIVQQALTNTLSHGGSGVTAQIDVRRVDGDLLIEVVDDGRAAPAPPGPARRGQGLIGMRERVALFGGELSAGPRPEGGFAVRARIPLVDG
ncbi:MAG: sensor histidine kinase [Actinomycetota bacterium]